MKPQIKIGTKEEVVWTKMKDSCEQRIKEMEDAMMVDKAVLKLAKDKILLEQRK